MKFKNISGLRISMRVDQCKKGQLILEAGQEVDLSEKEHASLLELYGEQRLGQYLAEVKEASKPEPKAEEAPQEEPKKKKK